jgi:ribonuclease VapC
VSRIVLDSSAVIALFRGEPGADVVAAALGRALISAANLAEVYGRLLRDASRPDELRRDLEALRLTIQPFDQQQAYVAGRMEAAGRQFGLSLGDRACLALASILVVPAMTADRQWRNVDVGVEVLLIR